MASTHRFKAVVFDLGGVIFSSPVEGLKEFAKQQGYVKGGGGGGGGKKRRKIRGMSIGGKRELKMEERKRL